ncbi:alpha-amylase family glycosyl hydrolase [Almyronema epifaneia]|uniref:Alpha-amylase family glycosyl hydrolase n=1 Tax=Almyronema epifaneia S1 TaxID=2991925 RepID=A0ABW6IE82_9CYAN
MARQRIAYRSTPDYTQPLIEVPAKVRDRLFERLSFLYGSGKAKRYLPELERLLKVHCAHKVLATTAAEPSLEPGDRFSEKDLVLITYGDLIQGQGRSPLASLAQFLQQLPKFANVINTLHILPFFPYSSDRGFSITDFHVVDPKLGSWQDITALGSQYQLMFDGVFNHVSAQSLAFQEMLNGNPLYRDVFTTYTSPGELTLEQRQMILRPRTSDILTQYHSINGPVWVWTTFSPDQIDLNYRNPHVLLGVVETLLLYVRRGANIIRLDAVTYLWDEPGTTGANLAQTHEVIKLLRDVLSVADPTVSLITETNIPHADNIAYFGDGTDEAHMVYNFALPPLVLYTFYQQDATALTNWAKTLTYPSATTTFFNILDTHDGIGLMGVKDILPAAEIQFLLQQARDQGAFISYRTSEKGQKEPYEINTTWFSALSLDSSPEDLSFQVKRYVASRSLALVLRGVPGIYLHGLMGSQNDVDTVLRTQSKRDINRQIIRQVDIIKAIADPQSKLSHLMQQLGRLLEIRVRQPAFHPNGAQRILALGPEVFAVLRISPDCTQHILTLTNVTACACRLEISLAELGITGLHPTELAPASSSDEPIICAIPDDSHWYDLVGRRGWRATQQKLAIALEPYDVVWLVPFVELEQAIESG